ncbi:hypothetical protein SLS62_003351 [Diatrype stigma]|uniref:Uncharacterized protein n=1 Tax=Diatrype stigma TaxID=117547 RepID=A0AAN9USH0_9PEZI
MAYLPPATGGQGTKRFLSCTTSTARLNIRRALFPHQRVLSIPRLCRAACSISVLDTKLYKNEPILEEYCPVITLEDSKGRWAGLLRVMDDNTDIEAQQTVEIVAISQGSSSRIEAALAYEETVDRLACYRFGDINSDHCHFALTRSSRHKKETCQDGNDTPEGSHDHGVVRVEGNYEEKMKSKCYERMEKEVNRVDQGPFFLKGIDCESYQDDVLPKDWRNENYEFYNVLWIERRDGFVERMAAGRVPKDIWEQNQGAPEKIRLG